MKIEDQMDDSSPNTGYETSDVDPKPVIWFGVALAAMVAVTIAAMAWMFDYLAAREDRLDASGSPLADTRERPAAPPLQVTPSSDLTQMRAREEALLNSYGWVDRQEGLVRIPIERAMEILAGRGLGTQPGGGGSAGE